MIPPAVDTELNPEGRAMRGHFRADLDADTFVAAVMEQLKRDAPEIAYGSSAGLLRASKAELDERFERMNAMR